MASPRRNRFRAFPAVLLAVALVAVAAGVFAFTRARGGDDCGEFVGDVRIGDAAPLAWSAEPGPAAEATGAIDALVDTEAIGEFRGAMPLTAEAGGTTIYSTARDGIIAIVLSNTADNQVARSVAGVSPDAASEPWVRSFTGDLVTTDTAGGVLYALGLDGDRLDVMSVRGATGEDRWCRSLDGSGDVESPAVSADRVDDGDLVVGRYRSEDGGAVVARLDQEDGDSVWTTDGEDLPLPVRLVAGPDVVAFGGRRAADDRPAYADADQPGPAAIVALDPSDGSEAWRYAPAEEGGIQWHPYLVGEAAGMYIVLDHGAREVTAGTVTAPRLVGIDAAGEVRWTESLRSTLDVSSEDILVEGEVVVVAGARGSDGARPLTARNVADGAQAWEVDLRTGVLRPNRVAVSDGWLLTAGLAGIEAVDLSNGNVEVVLDGTPVPDIAAEPDGLVAVEAGDSILVFDPPA